MAINKKESKKILMFGAIAGLATPPLLKYVITPVLGFISGIFPAVSAKLAEANPGTIDISVTDSLTGINGGLSKWLVDAMGLTLNYSAMTLIMAAIGGALLFWLGAMVSDRLNLLKGNKIQKTRKVIFTGSLLAAFIIGGFAVPAIGIGLIEVLIAFGINAAILALLFTWIDKQFKLGIIPF